MRDSRQPSFSSLSGAITRYPKSVKTSQDTRVRRRLDDLFINIQTSAETISERPRISASDASLIRGLQSRCCSVGTLPVTLDQAFEEVACAVDLEMTRDNIRIDALCKPKDVRTSRVSKRSCVATELQCWLVEKNCESGGLHQHKGFIHLSVWGEMLPRHNALSGF